MPTRKIIISRKINVERSNMENTEKCQKNCVYMSIYSPDIKKLFENLKKKT